METIGAESVDVDGGGPARREVRNGLAGGGGGGEPDVAVAEGKVRVTVAWRRPDDG